MIHVPERAVSDWNKNFRVLWRQEENLSKPGPLRVCERKGGRVSMLCEGGRVSMLCEGPLRVRKRKRKRKGEYEHIVKR
jgi:hypothetical protein